MPKREVYWFYIVKLKWLKELNPKCSSIAKGAPRVGKLIMGCIGSTRDFCCTKLKMKQ